MKADGASKDHPLDLPAEAHEKVYTSTVSRCVAWDASWWMMGPVSSSSVTYWAVAPIVLTDRLNAPRVGPAVGVRTGEGREEGVVDVDDPARVSIDELGLRSAVKASIPSTSSSTSSARCRRLRCQCRPVGGALVGAPRSGEQRAICARVAGSGSENKSAMPLAAGLLLQTTTKITHLEDAPGRPSLLGCSS